VQTRKPEAFYRYIKLNKHHANSYLKKISTTIWFQKPFLKGYNDKIGEKQQPHMKEKQTYSTKRINLKSGDEEILQQALGTKEIRITDKRVKKVNESLFTYLQRTKWENQPMFDPSVKDI
jgi:hypothetical protein